MGHNPGPYFSNVLVDIDKWALGLPRSKNVQHREAQAFIGPARTMHCLISISQKTESIYNKQKLDVLLLISCIDREIQQDERNVTSLKVSWCISKVENYDGYP